MRILHITKKYPNALGGDANVVRSLELHQKRSGHEVAILTTNSVEIQQNENVIRFGLPDTATNLDIITLKRIISLVCFIFTSIRVLLHFKPDIIHAHSAEMGFLVSFPAKLAGIPVIQTCHGICFNDRSFSPAKRALEGFFLKYGAFQCITTVDKSSLVDFLRQRIDHIVYIPNGVDETRFSVFKKPRGHYPVTFFFVGRLEYQKGLDVLIRAVVDLRKVAEGFNVKIIGNGSLRDELASQIAVHSLEDTVHLVGSVEEEELVRQFMCSYALVLPSRWEGMPLTLLEAWAAGLPAIVTNVGGLTGVCRNMENALIVKPGDPSSLCQAMHFLMEHPDIAERLGSEGNRIARTKYSWNSVGDVYITTYLQIMHRNMC